MLSIDNHYTCQADFDSSLDRFLVSWRKQDFFWGVLNDDCLVSELDIH